jgi:hypothetical protein
MVASDSTAHQPGNPQWPQLPYNEWKDTLASLHRWCQIVGKVRLVQTPWINHSWHATFYPTARGLTTSPIPYETRSFQIDFDFLDQALRIHTHEGKTRPMTLKPRAVADFYRKLFKELDDLRLPVRIHPKPNEMLDATPFDQDRAHSAYQGEYANRFWRALLQAERVMLQFRARFIGKCSPVHLFWGGLDLACTRFSGQPAPPHPGGIPNCPDWVTREAYSHEVCSAGFWPGNDQLPYPLFYSYAYPEPPGFKEAKVRPDEAFYEPAFGEFILPYDVVRTAASPDAVLLDFLQSSYDAAADLGHWNRAALERDPPVVVQHR